MKTIIKFLLMVTLFLVCQSPSYSQKSRKKGQSSPANPFADQVKEHFKNWDKNNDGKINEAESNLTITNKSVSGDQAAAILAVHYLFIKSGNPKEFTKEEILNRGSWKPTGNPGEFKGSDLLGAFASYSDKLKNINRKLFIGEPSPIGMHQGMLGDCYLISTIGALAKISPNKIKEMVKEKSDGSYEVHFADKNFVTVNKLTDTEMIAGASTDGQGCWLRVMESAFGKRKAMNSGNKTKGTKVGSANKADYDFAVGHGGTQEEVINALTGHQPITLKLSKDLKQLVAIFGEAGKKITLASIYANKQVPPGFDTGHGYAILGYDKKNNKVKVWNPHGNEFHPMGPEGMKNGFIVKNGAMDITVDDFAKVFDQVVYEKK